jgi:hypothetical protein
MLKSVRRQAESLRAALGAEICKQSSPELRPKSGQTDQTGGEEWSEWSVVLEPKPSIWEPGYQQHIKVAQGHQGGSCLQPRSDKDGKSNRLTSFNFL